MLLLAVCCGSALASYYPSPKHPSKPAAGYKGSQYGKPEYSYAYGIDDKQAGIKLDVKESRDGKRTVGEYITKLPDGRNQKVSYYVDGKSGFVADVKYDGVARHPVSDKKPVKPGKYVPPKSATYTGGRPGGQFGYDDDNGYGSTFNSKSAQFPGYASQDIYSGQVYQHQSGVSPYEQSSNLFRQQFYN